jgi:hypothetical protein
MVAYLVREPPPDEIRYLKLVIRNGILAGAVLLGALTETTSIIDGGRLGQERVHDATDSAHGGHVAIGLGLTPRPA